MFNKVKQFIDERNIWINSGKPYRTAERMLEIYSICSGCPNFTEGALSNSCGICGCRLHPTDTVYPNKIAWATTECPEKKWLVEEGVTRQESEIQLNVEMPPESTGAAQKKDCGCGRKRK